jgi:methyl-accepting chemotaxis protein
MAVEAGQAMGALVTRVQGAAALIDRVSHTAQEQALGIAQVGQAVAEIDVITQQNAALVEEGSAAAESLRQQASLLVGAVRVFKLT